MANSSQRLIFVGGSPRSGTTLVQNMLDSHPRILGGPEFLHLPTLVDLRRKLHFSIAREYINIICTKDEVDSYLASFVEKFFLRLADTNQCEFYSEKTPMNILVFSELIELFPEAHFIQVIRDPRAIISSMLQVKKRAVGKGVKPPYFTANLAACIAYVQQCFNAGFAAAQKTSGNVMTIVYEHLLTDSDKETKKICNFLGIEWNDRMLYPGEKEHLGEQAITTHSDEIWYDSGSYKRNLDAKSLEKWQSQLSLGQQLRTILAFKDNGDLTQYGYDFSLGSLAQANYLLARMYYFYLWSGKKIYGISSRLARKIPGILLVKRGAAAIQHFLQ
jgi:protein-tyrosine sulfotransferase